MMTENEKIQFLKKMGLSGNILTENSLNPKKEKKNLHVDRSDLVNLARKFDVMPGKKSESLTEFLDKEKK